MYSFFQFSRSMVFIHIFLAISYTGSDVALRASISSRSLTLDTHLLPFPGLQWTLASWLAQLSCLKKHAYRSATNKRLTICFSLHLIRLELHPAPIAHLIRKHSHQEHLGYWPRERLIKLRLRLLATGISTVSRLYVPWDWPAAQSKTGVRRRFS